MVWMNTTELGEEEWDEKGEEASGYASERKASAVVAPDIEAAAILVDTPWMGNVRNHGTET